MVANSAESGSTPAAFASRDDLFSCVPFFHICVEEWNSLHCDTGAVFESAFQARDASRPLILTKIDQKCCIRWRIFELVEFN
jgi:hypothetical protein